MSPMREYTIRRRRKEEDGGTLSKRTRATSKPCFTVASVISRKRNSRMRPVTDLHAQLGERERRGRRALYLPPAFPVPTAGMATRGFTRDAYTLLSTK